MWSKSPGLASRKTAAVGVRKPGQRQAGKWCSNWCCCGVGWHGEACDDVDECASSPCKNGGSCSESSSTYLVNDYFRKYRCSCTNDFRGHACDTPQFRGTKKNTCTLQHGAKSATSTQKAYLQFQAALEFMGVTLRSSDADFEGFCVDVYEHHEHGGVCGQQFVLRSKTGHAIATPVVNCKSSTGGSSGCRELYAVMSLCASPCMKDPTSKCCFVPEEVANLFPCCRALGCCPDQQGKQSSRRALGRLVGQRSPRETPRIAATVSVEEVQQQKHIRATHGVPA